MAYLTVEELESRKDRRQVWEWANDADLGYDELQDDDDELAIAEANVDAAIDRASTEIDDALKARMTVPIVAPDGIIKGLCADITMYFLAKRRRTEVPADLQNLYDEAKEALAAYNQGGSTPPFAGRDETEPFAEEE